MPKTLPTPTTRTHTVQELCITHGLYYRLEIPIGVREPLIIGYWNFEGTLDSYCPTCKQESVFRLECNEREVGA